MHPTHTHYYYYFATTSFHKKINTSLMNNNTGAITSNSSMQPWLLWTCPKVQDIQGEHPRVLSWSEMGKSSNETTHNIGLLFWWVTQEPLTLPPQQTAYSNWTAKKQPVASAQSNVEDKECLHQEEYPFIQISKSRNTPWCQIVHSKSLEYLACPLCSMALEYPAGGSLV